MISMLIRGRGGLGVVELGNMISTFFIMRGLHSTAVPTYGPQTRGGYVESKVVASQLEVDNPLPDSYDVLIAMDNVGVEGAGRLRPGGLALVNSSLAKVDRVRLSTDSILEVPGTEIAEGRSGAAREIRVLSNAAMFGAFVAASGGSTDDVAAAIRASMEGREESIVELNSEVARIGYEYAADRLTPSIRAIADLCRA